MNVIKEGGEEAPDVKKVANEPDKNGEVAAPKWDQLDD